MRRALLVVFVAALALPASASASPRFVGSTADAAGVSRVAVGDFDGDGRHDLAFAYAQKVAIRLNTASANDEGPSWKTGAIIDAGFTVNDVAAADLNADGR